MIYTLFKNGGRFKTAGNSHWSSEGPTTRALSRLHHPSPPCRINPAYPEAVVRVQREARRSAASGWSSCSLPSCSEYMHHSQSRYNMLLFLGVFFFPHLKPCVDLLRCHLDLLGDQQLRGGIWPGL